MGVALRAGPGGLYAQPSGQEAGEDRREPRGQARTQAGLRKGVRGLWKQQTKSRQGPSCLS